VTSLPNIRRQVVDASLAVFLGRTFGLTPDIRNPGYYYYKRLQRFLSCITFFSLPGFGRFALSHLAKDVPATPLCRDCLAGWGRYSCPF